MLEEQQTVTSCSTVVPPSLRVADEALGDVGRRDEDPGRKSPNVTQHSASPPERLHACHVPTSHRLIYKVSAWSPSRC